MDHLQLQVALAHQPVQVQAETSMQEATLSNGGLLLSGRKVQKPKILQTGKGATCLGGGGGGSGGRGKISSSKRHTFIGRRHNFRIKAVFQGVELAIWRLSSYTFNTPFEH